MSKSPDEYLKEARRVAREAGLLITHMGAGFKLYRKTPARVVFLGRRSSASGICSLVKRCAVAK